MTPPPPAAFVLGAGRAGRALAWALRDAGVPLTGLHGRRALHGPMPVSAGPLPAAIADADVVIVAVRDEQLDAALDELRHAPLAPRQVVLHLSGSREPAALAPLRAAGHPAGTFHPLVPLIGPESATALRGAWVGVDGDPAAIACARRLAGAVGAHVLRLPPGAKPAYHAAAVLASNFPVVLATLATRVLRESGVEPEAALGAVRALLTGAAHNVSVTVPEEALTGPVVRGDAGAVAAHLEALAGDPTARAVYVALTRAALETRRAAGAEASERLAAIDRLLGAGPG
ncbi:MAG TPA: DUF2520 domain-containing protein [Gemmatimonadaceae bacterium]|nr:DUF2520 domain-containing protein [Gemmatimonadaceae bacterium]